MSDLKIAITTEEGLYIAKLYYEYNSVLSIIQYLVASENPPKNNYLDSYNKEAKKLFFELEIAKKELVEKYCKENHIKLYQKYNIMFDDEYILFTGAEIC